MFQRNAESDPQTSNSGRKNRKKPSPGPGSNGATLLLMEEEEEGEEEGRQAGEWTERGDKQTHASYMPFSPTLLVTQV